MANNNSSSTFPIITQSTKMCNISGSQIQGGNNVNSVVNIGPSTMGQVVFPNNNAVIQGAYFGPSSTYTYNNSNSNIQQAKTPGNFNLPNNHTSPPANQQQQIAANQPYGVGNTTPGLLVTGQAWVS